METKIARPNFNLSDVTKLWLDSKLGDIEKITNKDVLTIYGAIHSGIDFQVRLAVEGLHKRKNTLLVILHTGGGFVEEVHNIVQVLRKHYEDVHFLVPICAMSAGTVLALSGNKIYMDYFSRLGPIDPQIDVGNDMVPALSYLRQFEKIIEKSKKGELSPAEYALLGKLDLARLHQLELAASLSVSLISDWLAKYKFKDWKENGQPVSEKRRRAKAKEIAESLNDHEKWYTHRFSIHKDVLERDLGLIIDDYSTDTDLKKSVWGYFWPLMEYTSQVDSPSLIHSRGYI